MKAIIQTVRDGPLQIRGEHAIQRGDGALIASSKESWLCRCGQSENKPFCDSSHKRAQFTNDGSGGKYEPKPTDRTDIAGALSVSLKANGPLRCAGEMEVRDANGRVLFAGSQTALCRCGASKNKPFCDGSHTLAGFKTD